MTNGDRIRQMSNEELDEIFFGSCYWCKCYNDVEDCEGVDCKTGIKAYLESEVE